MATGIISDIQRTVVGKAAVDSRFIRGGIHTVLSLDTNNLTGIPSDIRHAGMIILAAGVFYKYVGNYTFSANPTVGGQTIITDANWINLDNWKTLVTIEDVGNTITSAQINETGNLIITIEGGNTLDAGTAKGDKGDKGDDGVKGDKGDGWTNGDYDASNGVVTFYSNDGLQFSTSDLRGSNGTNGTNGTNGSNGINGTNGVDGAGVYIKGSNTISNILSLSNPIAGDLYIATTNATSGGITTEIGEGVVWSGTEWINVGAIRGPQGLTGNSGTNGTNGTNGSNGSTGAQGTPGSSSYDLWIDQGNSGDINAFFDTLSGSNGTNGSNGSNGTNGTAGTIAIGTVTNLSAGTTPTVTNTGTANAAVLNFGIPQGLDGTGGGGGGGTLTNALTAGVEIGSVTSGTNFSAGTSLETILTSMFAAPFVAPTIRYISSAQLKNNGVDITTSKTFNYGSSLTYDEVKWNTAGATGTPTATQLSCSHGNTTIDTLNDTSSPATFAQNTVTKAYSSFSNSTTGHRMFIKLKNTKGNGAAGTTRTACTLTFKAPKLWGASTSNLSSANSSLMTSLISQTVVYSTSKTISVTGNANTNSTSKYTYIAYPSFYGNLSDIRFSSNAGTNQYHSGMQISTDFVFNFNGIYTKWDVYKFSNYGPVPNGEGVTIS